MLTQRQKEIGIILSAMVLAALLLGSGSGLGAVLARVGNGGHAASRVSGWHGTH